MANIWHIFRRELGNYFTTPIAYVVLTLFLIIANYFFYLIVSQFVSQFAMAQVYQAQGMMSGDFNINANEMIITPMFYQMAVVMLFLAPMLTMRLFSEENQLGTVELLLTCPVRDIEVILGKFFAAMAVFALMFALTLLYPIFLAFQTDLEIGPILAGFLGIAALAAVFVSIGLLFSALTENQIVAGALTFATLLMLWLLAGLVQSDTVTGGAQSFLRECSIILRFEDFASGVINLGDLTYYATATALGIFLTVNVLDARVH